MKQVSIASQSLKLKVTITFTLPKMNICNSIYVQIVQYLAILFTAKPERVGKNIRKHINTHCYFVTVIYEGFFKEQ